MELLGDILLLIGGLALLLAGGDRTVKGASVLASNLGVPPIAVGLTVVAFGTSAPELVVNVMSAVRGSSIFPAASARIDASSRRSRAIATSRRSGGPFRCRD